MLLVDPACLMAIHRKWWKDVITWWREQLMSHMSWRLIVLRLNQFTRWQQEVLWVIGVCLSRLLVMLPFWSRNCRRVSHFGELYQSSRDEDRCDEVDYTWRHHHASGCAIYLCGSFCLDHLEYDNRPTFTTAANAMLVNCSLFHAP